MNTLVKNTNIGAKVVFKCSAEDKNLFSSSSCSVTVSVGNKAQEGVKLAATIQGITSRFKECTIMVCDSLQRHNMLTSSADLNIAHKEANEAGKAWLERNKKYFSLFTIPYNVIHWDYWFFSDQYKLARSKIDNLFIGNEEYRKSFFYTAESFSERFKKKGNKNLNREIIIENSLEYLKEECTVVLLWAENKYNFEIYPSKRNLAMATTHEYFIKPLYPDVLKPISLDIRTTRTPHDSNKKPY